MATSRSKPSTKPKSPRAVACAHVYRKFRDLEGAKPTVRPAGPNKVFTFKGRIDMGAGKPKLTQIVKVTVNPAGKIVKVVASR